MENILLIIHSLIALALVGVVLMQRSEGGALGMGGGSGGGSGGPGMFSARGTASALTRATAILAAAFMATSLGLAVLAGTDESGQSIFDQPLNAPVEGAPSTSATGAEDGPSVPLSE